MPTSPAVLIVDDEQMVLSSLRGVFTLQTDYDVLEAKNGKDALSELERSRVDVIISDFLMPEMNGIEFLKEAKRIQPDAARLLLTGYADKENAIKAINDVGIYHYLEKPWDNDALLNIVRNALAEKGLRARLADKVHELDLLVREHTDLESRHNSLKRELQMAARVQRSLLPTSFPELESYAFANIYEPCEAVGGDFFDVLRKQDSAFLLISDVIGHGVQAALTTMLLKGVFQETAADTDDPVELFTEMNRRLHSVLPTGMYAAAAIFRLRDGDPEVSFSNAGLPYPFVLRSEKRLDEIILTGSPLGLFPSGTLPFESRSIHFESGDVLFAGSDGLGSIINGEGDFFEDEELRRTLKDLTGQDGQTVIETAMKRATVFANGEPRPDDVNLVAVTRK